MKNKLKHIGIIILILAIIAGGLIYFFRAKIIARYIPTVEQVGEIQIVVKNDTSYISSRLVVKNNTFLKIKIDTIKYNVSLFDKTYLQNEKFIGAVLRGHGMDTIEFSLKIPYVTLLKDLKAERKKGDSVSYAINVALQYSTAFGKAEFPINKSAKIKIPQPPELEVMEIKYTKVRLKKIQAFAKIKIINYSDLTLTISEMSYSMKILKQGNLKGNYKTPITIKPNETTFVNLPIEITASNLGKTMFQILVNNDDYDYLFTLSATLESSDPYKESFHIDLSKMGNMELKK